MRSLIARVFTALVIVSLVPLLPAAGKKKKKNEEEITQTLEVPPDPPAALKVETSRLSYFVSPLTAKGLLSPQIRESIKALWKMSQGTQIVKLRAFVAGTGDMRRVQSIVAEMFSDKKQQLPVVSVIQVGGLPMEGAQVVIEATALTKKPSNPNGLAFISGQAATGELKADAPKLLVAPLAQKSVSMLRKVLDGTQLAPKDVLRVTCFSSSLDDYTEVHRIVSSEFPGSSLNIVQVQRSPTNAVVECEAVARLQQAPKSPVELVNPPGIPPSPNYSQAALVNTPRITLTGTQLAFRAQDADIRLAFDRLKSTLQQSNTPIRSTVMSSIYPLSRTVADKVRALRFEFYDKSRPPASTMLPFEGLPSLDASFAVDVIAIPEN